MLFVFSLTIIYIVVFTTDKTTKEYICVISIVAPYRFLRDELKEDFNFLEVYLHTSDIRGREDFFAKDYEKPIDPKHLSIDTGKLNDLDNDGQKIIENFEKSLFDLAEKGSLSSSLIKLSLIHI